MTEGIGARVLRKEDQRFLTGCGRFVADLRADGALHFVLLRSLHASARIRGIDVRRAAAGAGVVAVLTGADMQADGVGPMRTLWLVHGADGPAKEPARWALAREFVRYVGEPVAVVLAESQSAAIDAAEEIVVDYEELAVVVRSADASAAGAPLVHGSVPGNVCVRFLRGDPEKVRSAMARAAHVVRMDLVNHRIAGAALEPRAVLALPGTRGEPITLYSTTQVPHHVRRLVAEQLDLHEAELRVIATDMGGGFGYKGKHYPEETIAVWAARRLGRPVKWIASRSESFIADLQARDHITRAELALDTDGRFLALRVSTLANLGAYVSTFGAAIPTVIYSGLLAGVYTTPAIDVEVTAVFTHTMPTDAYRGAGRPEACYVLERLADRAARELGIDRAEIRRRNFVPAASMPYATPIGPTYDCGDFPRIFARALSISDYAGFERRRALAAAQGRLRGLGLACFVESSGVAPSKLAGALGARAGFYESAEIRIDATGSATVLLGTHNHGQGHATTFAQIVVSRLGIPFEHVEIVEGDTGRVPYGTGTFGSRSIAVGGSALARAADKILDKGRRIAAHLLEASETDIEFSGRLFRVGGTDRQLSFAEIAFAAHTAHNLPPGMEPGLQETAFYDPQAFAFSNGAHVCEVEVDAETGVTQLLGYWVVDDVGTVINPTIVEGQIHGGLAQGIGQAMIESVIYDPRTGQIYSASFLDYGIPRADMLPGFVSETDESQPCTHNPLGAKGCGESGAIGAPAAVTSAILDALAILGVSEIEMPLTPERIWRAIRSAANHPEA